MPTPTDINSQIALKKGWMWEEELHICSAEMGYAPSHWRNPEGQPAIRPDFTGTLQGVAQLMQELQSRRKPMSQWAWYWNDRKQRFVMRHACFRRRLFRRQIHAIFYSPKHDPGLCVGTGWLSVFGREAADDRSE